jgi:hypothetical protein
MRLIALFLLGICLTVVLPHGLQAQQVTIPTKILENRENQILVPAWEQIGLADLPPIQSSGEDFGRTWRKGQTPDKFLNLGDLANALEPQVLSLESIGSSLPEPADLSEVRLASFPLAGRQTLAWLADIVPGMQTQIVQDNSVLNALVSSTAKTVDLSETLGEVLESNPTLRQVQLQEIDLNPYKIRDIPNLAGVYLEKFVGWKDALIKDIPKLGNLPLGAYPIPVEPRGDLALRISEIGVESSPEAQKMLSGSSAYGFEVYCKNCTSIQLIEEEDSEEEDNVQQQEDDQERYYWVGGAFQQLEGGYGCLKGEKEPTGRHPFGETFKVVLTRLDNGKVEASAYFRWATDCGMSAYRIGPVPLITYAEDSILFVGRSINQQERDLAEINPDAVSDTTRSSVCSESSEEEDSSPNAITVGGVEVRAAADAIAKFFSDAGLNYDSIGTYGCDRDICGRRLGKYAVFSQDNDLRKIVDPKWLDSIESISKSELLDYFPPIQQDEFLFNQVGVILTNLHHQTDPSTERSLEGERLLNFLVSAYFGGSEARDFQLSPVGNPQTLKQAQQTIVEDYLETTADGGCK